MQFITLLDLHTGTDAVLEKGKQLSQSAAAQLYLPRIRGLRDELAVFTGRDPTKLPLAYRTELAQTDARHDGLGRALFGLTEVYLQHPDATPEQRAAATSVRAAFLPTTDELNASYETESEAARRRRPLLARHRDALKALPLGAKQTAYGVAKKMLDAGDELGALLQKRADAGAKRVPVDTRALLRVRGSLIGALTRFRSALDDESGHNGVTPERVAELFARLDEKSAKREGSAARKKSSATRKNDAKKGAVEKRVGKEKPPGEKTPTA